MTGEPASYFGTKSERVVYCFSGEDPDRVIGSSSSPSEAVISTLAKRFLEQSTFGAVRVPTKFPKRPWCWLQRQETDARAAISLLCSGQTGETAPCPFALMRPTDGEESEREGSSLMSVQHIRSLPSHV